MPGQSQNYAFRYLSYETASGTEDNVYNAHAKRSNTEDGSDSVKRPTNEILNKTGEFLDYFAKFSYLVPLLGPKKDRKVQFCMVVCLICLAADRVFNVLIPRQLGIIVDQLSAEQNPFRALLVWLALSAISEEGAIGLIKTLVRIPTRQFSYRQITNSAFNHIMSLSMDFHTAEDSAEMMAAVQQGKSLTNFLETLILEILPSFLDLLISFGLLCWKFNSYVAIAIAAAAATFISVEVTVSNRNINNRQEYSKAEREEARVMHQAVQGWQTVTCFNMLTFEKQRLSLGVDKQLAASLTWGMCDAYIQGMLDFLLPCMFFIIASLILYETSQGRSSPGDFAFFVRYWEELMWPLKTLFHNYRYMLSDLGDAKRLGDLFQTKSTIIDREDAKDLDKAQGYVKYRSVHFSYSSGKETIRDFSL
ncbi:hypothetical protein BFJ69_g7858 [Fusarium oxysporum]|uniref:ABC transmembrane type-1 domain-containing protein n=1 Tax=Fusarium oxysporum TaxID=5507 RepID=A0A420N4T4_FUSOX|nr:hypothetical protein BFJ69_g7858 [Fusarium oxysporum]